MGELSVFRGWVESEGRVLAASEVAGISAEELSRCGGEFVLERSDLTARDCYGIMPGRPEAGIIVSGEKRLPVVPVVPELPLSAALWEAVRLRCSDDAVVALSGGVDSCLVAAIAVRCGVRRAVAVGAPGSHDLKAARSAAEVLGLDLTVRELTDADVRAALPQVKAVLSGRTQMDIELGTAGWFICSLANELGAERILTGQAADELFAGYARYSRTASLRADMEKDFAGLVQQREREALIAGQFGVWYSMPFMDERVVRASRRFSAEELVEGDRRKIALRKAAVEFLPEEIAWRPKKAMQYGSGVTKLLKRV
ncbi:MAG: asparagine synthase C-terminal domain-containing protein [Methanocorpusculum sp.]|nr:asparagine synthase C-terminal domain-containing protein [Methanocorpusculum sp.]